MKKRISINWGKWVRAHQQEKWIVDEIKRVSRYSKRWTIAAIVIIILFTSVGISLNYFVGARSSEKIDASTRQMLSAYKESVRQTLNTMNPNDFVFRLFADGDWYAPTPINEYVTLNVLPVKHREISLNFSIKNRSEFPARNVYCMVLFSNKEFEETGDDVVNRLEGLEGLNVYNVNSSDDYLNEAAAFEWIRIPQNTQASLRRKVALTLKGNTGRLTVKINFKNRLSFEFQLQESQDD